MRHHHSLLLLFGALAAVALLGACTGGARASKETAPAAFGSPPSEAKAAQGPNATSKIRVLATAYPLAYLAERVGGDRVSVSALVPPGAEAHDWEPSARDIAAVQAANVFLYNGAGFEPWAERLAGELSSGRPLTINATEGLPLLERDGALSKGNGHPDAPDPHLWLDPALYLRQGERVADALQRADPAGGELYTRNLSRLTQDLESLAQEMEQGLSSCSRHTLIVSHAAFGYLAQRFGLRQVAISGLSPEVEPSPARLRELVRQVKESGATHVFFETLANPAVAKTLAKEVGAQTLTLNPLEGLTRQQLQDGENYPTVMRRNLSNLRVALGCR